VLAGLALALLAAGCLPKSKHPMPAPEPISLEIHNHAFADVDVYVAPSGSGSGSIRLTTVSGFANATVRVRAMQLQPGDILQVQLHAIGSTSRWTSPALSVSPGERVALEINSDGYGGLGRTVMYPLPDTTDLGTAPLPRPVR
jgi:nitrous oxide reductase accessory protein NosL